jgi:hypothetical protein
MLWQLLNVIGLIAGTIGSVLVAISVGPNPGGGYQSDGKGERIFLASILSPGMFKFGIWLIFAGFALQFVPAAKALWALL